MDEPDSSSSGNSMKKFGGFFVLYFVQGLPYGLQNRYLPLHFRMEGVSLATVTLFKLLMIPWIFKLFFAPFVDNYFTKKIWLNGMMIILAILCIVAMFTPPSSLNFLAIIMLLFNVATAVQDVALDSFVIDTCTPLELSKGNVAQVVGYKLGVLFAGGVFAILAQTISWESIFAILTFLYLMGLFIGLFFLPEEPPRVEISPSSSSHNTPVVENALRCYFWKIFDTPGTTWMLLFLLFYKTSEQGVQAMYPMFLLDNNVSPQATGFWTGLLGQIFSIFGSVVGGILNPRKVLSHLKIYIVTRGFSSLVLFLGIWFWNSYSTLSYYFSAVALQIILFCGGAVTTIMYTLSMQLSQTVPSNCRASHYTTLVTSDVLGRLLFPSVLGALTEWLGYLTVFGLLASMAIQEWAFLSFTPAAIKGHAA